MVPKIRKIIKIYITRYRFLHVWYRNGTVNLRGFWGKMSPLQRGEEGRRTCVLRPSFGLWCQVKPARSEYQTIFVRSRNCSCAAYILLVSTKCSYAVPMISSFSRFQTKLICLPTSRIPLVLSWQETFHVHHGKHHWYIFQVVLHCQGQTSSCPAGSQLLFLNRAYSLLYSLLSKTVTAYTWRLSNFSITAV